MKKYYDSNYHEQPNISVGCWSGGTEFQHASYMHYMRHAYWFAKVTLEEAANSGIPRVIFRFSRYRNEPGNTTIKSQLTKLINSEDSTPFVNKSACVWKDDELIVSIIINETSDLYFEEKPSGLLRL